MKKLIPLMILATVVSCGKKETKKNGIEMIVNKLTDSQKVGLVSISTTKGESENVDINDKNEILGFKTQTYTDVTKKIILKKENSLVYSLEITKDGEAPEHRSVILEDNADLNNEIREAIENGKAEVKDNYLIANLDDEQSWDSELNGVKYGMKMKLKVKHKRNLKSDCESQTDIKITDVIGVIGDKETKLKDGKSTQVEECGGVMTKEELKALDLTKIQFCDYRVEDTECEDDKDMSFLTSDL